MTKKIRIYADLQKQVHEALREQHPEWVQPNGESPLCDSYEARFAELLQQSAETAKRRARARGFAWLG
jgi:hypothetical protein